MPITAENIIKNKVRDSESIRLLNNVSFTLKEEEVVLLYGPSGHGKTTLMKIMAGLLKPEEGKVEWNGTPVPGFLDASKFRHKHISMIFSNFYFLQGLNVEDNIRLPAVLVGMKPAVIEQRMAELYKLLFFEENRTRELSLEPRKRHRLHQLSNGQREIVAIARALLLDTPFIFADEMMRSFDDDTDQAVWDRLIGFLRSKKRSLFLITHEGHIKTYDHIDRVYELAGGSLKKVK